MSKAILDASAVLTLLYDEVGAEKVADYLPKAAISTINLAEVVTKLIEAGMSEMQTVETMGKLGLEIIPFSKHIAYMTANLRPLTRQ